MSEWRAVPLDQPDPSSERRGVLVLVGLFGSLFVAIAYPIAGIVGFTATLAILVVTLARTPRRSQAVEDTAEILDESAIGFCHVAYHFRGIAYGGDVGSLSIADGFLHFRGIRSEFSLGHGKFEAKRRTNGAIALTFAPHFHASIVIDACTDDDEFVSDDDDPDAIDERSDADRITEAASAPANHEDSQLYPPMTAFPQLRFVGNLALVATCLSCVMLALVAILDLGWWAMTLPWIAFVAITLDFHRHGRSIGSG